MADSCRLSGTHTRSTRIVGSPSAKVMRAYKARAGYVPLMARGLPTCIYEKVVAYYCDSSLKWRSSNTHGVLRSFNRLLRCELRLARGKRIFGDLSRESCGEKELSREVRNERTVFECWSNRLPRMGLAPSLVVANASRGDRIENRE